MRIAILTQPLRTNYGGILQNYALQQTLKEMGHEVYTLDLRDDARPGAAKILRRLAKFALGKIPAPYIFYERRFRKDYPVFTRHTRAFVDAHISLFPCRDLREELRPDSFDAYIVGSDQVWRAGYNEIGTMFLDFTGDWSVKRLAYSASFGTETWDYPPGETEACAALAKKFNAVSVREDSGITLCREHLGVEAVKLADPTLLLPKEHYEALALSSAAEAPNGRLFVHILDMTPQKEEIIRRLESEYDAPAFSCNQQAPETRLELPLEKRIQPPVEQWLRSFMDAEYVVTDSFHATVFSIIFRKKFLVLGNPQRGLTRIHSLLEGFGLEKCLFCSDKTPSFQEIDYLSKIFTIEQLIKEAREFLSRNLS